MDKKVVSIWLGKFNSKVELENYVEQVYDDSNDDDTSNCPFWNDYRIKYIDHDFQEIAWQEIVNDIEELIRGTSYWESYIEKVKTSATKIDISSYNSLILILKYEYDGKVQETINTKFIGTFEYDKGEDPDYMKDLFKKMGW